MAIGVRSRGMPEREDGYARPPIKHETKAILDKRKPDGVTYDHFIRELLGVSTN